MSRVSIRAGDYSPAALAKAVEAHFAALGVEGDLRPGMRVLLKPNLLAARRPEQGVTTHPALVQAVIDWLRARGVEEITLADSPGGLYGEGTLKGVYAASGMDALRGVSLNLDPGSFRREQPAGRVCRSFELIAPLAEADYVINLPKLKTHGMTTVSAGVKNLFGLVPGLRKPALHCRFPGGEEFAGMLLDLAQLAAPQVTLVDGVEAMEGNGPSGGTVRRLGYTFAARDLFTLDWFLCGAVMGIPPERVPMMRQAMERGLVEREPETVGDPLGEIPPFILPESRSADFADRAPRLLRPAARLLLNTVLRPRPRVLTEKCVGCGRCAESCPQQIIVVEGGKARIDLRRCISCFCCQEMCPVQAIGVRRAGWARRPSP